MATNEFDISLDKTMVTSSYWDNQEDEMEYSEEDGVVSRNKIFLSDEDIQDQDDFEYGSTVDYDFLTLNDQLHEIKNVEIEDGTPPNNYSLVLAEIILNELKKVDTLPSRITLSIEGGYCFVFRNDNLSIYLEIYNDGEIGLIAEDFINKQVIENKEITLKEIATSIKSLFIGE